MLPITAVLVVGAASNADARPRPSHSIRKRFESNKGFGLGLELGAPTAITGKYWLGEGSDRALQFGVGYMDYYYDWRGFTAYGDYLVHLVSLASTESFELPFYIGGGIQYWYWQDYSFSGLGCNPGAGIYCSGNALGARVPIGISFDFNNVPLDVFLQLTPSLDFFFGEPGDYPHGFVQFIIGASVGIRYYFN